MLAMCRLLPPPANQNVIFRGPPEKAFQPSRVGKELSRDSSSVTSSGETILIPSPGPSRRSVKCLVQELVWKNS